MGFDTYETTVLKMISLENRQVKSAAEPMTPDQSQVTAKNPEKVNQLVIDRNHVGTGGNPDDMEEADEEDTAKYPPRLQLSLLTTALMVTIFLSQLDKSIVVNAIPTITHDFDSLHDVGWYGSAFLLSQTATQPTWGRLYTYFNSKWLYILAVAIFEGGSIACAAAPNSYILIFGRAMAGAGSAGIFGGSLAVVTQIIPLKHRPTYIGLISCMFGVASLLGPLVGGIIIDSSLTWRFCFWINLPFGALTVLIVGFTYKPITLIHAGLPLKEKIKGLDLTGAILLTCGTTCLLLALQWGGTTYSWKTSKVWGSLIGFGVISSIFIALQIRAKDKATVPIHIATQRSVAIGCVFSICFSIAIITHTYFMPIYFQAIQQTSAGQSGVRILAYGLPITITTVVSGTIITKTGYYVPVMWFGAALFTTAATLLHTLQVDSTAREWVSYAILAGIGFGSAVQIPFLAINNVLLNKDIASGSAILIFSQSLGGALGLSISQNVFSTTLEKQLGRISGIKAAIIIVHGASDVQAVVPEAKLRLVLEGYLSAIKSVFVLPIVTAGIAFVVSWAMEQKRMGAKGRQK